MGIRQTVALIYFFTLLDILGSFVFYIVTIFIVLALAIKQIINIEINLYTITLFWIVISLARITWIKYLVNILRLDVDVTKATSLLVGFFVAAIEFPLLRFIDIPLRENLIFITMGFAIIFYFLSQKKAIPYKTSINWRGVIIQVLIYYIIGLLFPIFTKNLTDFNSQVVALVIFLFIIWLASIFMNRFKFLKVRSD